MNRALGKLFKVINHRKLENGFSKVYNNATDTYIDYAKCGKTEEFNDFLFAAYIAFSEHNTGYWHTQNNVALVCFSVI